MHRCPLGGTAQWMPPTLYRLANQFVLSMNKTSQAYDKFGFFAWTRVWLKDRSHDQCIKTRRLRIPYDRLAALFRRPDEEDDGFRVPGPGQFLFPSVHPEIPIPHAEMVLLLGAD